MKIRRCRNPPTPKELAAGHHQVGDLVGYDHDVRQVERNLRALVVVFRLEPLHQLFFAKLVVNTDVPDAGSGQQQPEVEGAVTAAGLSSRAFGEYLCSHENVNFYQSKAPDKSNTMFVLYIVLFAAAPVAAGL